MSKTSKLKYSQYHAGQNEDRIIREQWPGCPARGIFVDVGAGDGFTASNTLHFARNGWGGLLIDADPRQVTLLKQNRQGKSEDIIHTAICDHYGEAKIYLTPHLDHASLLKSTWNPNPFDAVIVPACRLETLLRRYSIHKIDLLSIDVEGAEMLVWHSFSWALHQPTCVVIEHEHCGDAGRGEMRSMFKGFGYRLLTENRSNFVYLLEPKPYKD